MRIAVILDKKTINTYIDYLEKKPSFINGIDFKYTKDNYIITTNTTLSHSQNIIIFKITISNSLTLNNIIKEFYLNEPCDMFRVYNIRFNNTEFLIKMCPLEKEHINSLKEYQCYKYNLIYDYNAFFDLFKFNDFNNDYELIQSLSIFFSNYKNMNSTNFLSNIEFLTKKLIYYGYHYDYVHQEIFHKDEFINEMIKITLNHRSFSDFDTCSINEGYYKYLMRYFT